MRLKQMIQFRLDHRLRRRVDASDVLQEVYVDAHQRLRHFLSRENYSFFIWLRHLTEQRLVDVHRQHLAAGKRDVRQEYSLHQKASATSASIARHIVAHMASPSQQVMERELMTRIEAGLRSLEQLDQEVLALRHFEELRNGEVAAVLGISEAAASNRYVRALGRLREVLAGCGVADE
ncbi:MAG: hypothetical protein Fues2KO_16680 [Fuerstiella sp.]